MGEASRQPESKEIRAISGGAALIGSAALALVLGLVTSALQIAGVINIAMAHLLMVAAWAVAVFSICLIESREYTPKWKLGLVVIVTLLLSGLDYWMVKKRAEIESAVAPMARLVIESDKDFYTVPQNNQPVPPKVSRFARIKVTCVGGKSIANVKAVVTRINDQEDWLLQLPLSSNDTLFKFPIVSMAVSASLNSGDSQYFDVVVECNGEIGCPKGQLAIPHIEGRSRFFATAFKIGSYSGPEEFAVRASGDGASPVTKIFVVSRGLRGQLMLEPKSGE